MVKSYSLKGCWNFSFDKEQIGIQEKWYTKKLSDTITLPGTISTNKKGTYQIGNEISYLTDPYLYEGYAWYQKEVQIEDEDLSKEIWLTLERTRITTVWIDDILIGTFDSLNAPHKYRLSNHIHHTSFTLTILISNINYPTKGGHLTSPDTQTNWNGILGEISLEIHDALYISTIKTYPDIHEKNVTLKLTTQNLTDTDQARTILVSARLQDIHGISDISIPVLEEKISFPSGKGIAHITYPLGEDAVLWSEHSPCIYALTIQIKDSQETIHSTFGLREFTQNKSAFLINGTKTFLRGKHDGLIFPMTGAVPATVEEWIRVMKIAKSYGINHYRFHTCCPPDAAFTAADLLGIYMEPQLPFWGTLTGPEEEGHNPVEHDYLVKEGYRMLDAFGNHPSYCMMSLGNELWGNKMRMSEILRDYKAYDNRHLYTQGSNNFQFSPVILPEDDFFVGVRLDRNRLFRGSYAMCDAPLGHVQTQAPSTNYNYDEKIHPTDLTEKTDPLEKEIEIQYGTGVKKVTSSETEGISIPEVPIVSHEIGQYCVFPNFHEISKYTGVLKARNLEIFQDRLKKKGMLDLADDFFYASGKLSVACYKEELEAAARSSRLAGYQILDIQDFSGQGTALVGILDAFMDSKGLITPEEWRAFCSDSIVLAQFEKYVWQSSEAFHADMAIRYYNPTPLVQKTLIWRLLSKETCIKEGCLNIPDHCHGLQQLGAVDFILPESANVQGYTLEISVEGTDIRNHYELSVYPQPNVNPSTKYFENNGFCVYLTHSREEASAYLSKGERVLYLPTECQNSIPGFYCTDFWCYPMFRGISEWMKKPLPVGTMGLLIQNEHPALAKFPSEIYSTPQWYEIVSHSHCMILDEETDSGYRPIVQMIDNFERNHKLGLLMEGVVGTGKLMISTTRFSEIDTDPAAMQYLDSILSYMTSDAFDPKNQAPFKNI